MLLDTSYTVGYSYGQWETVKKQIGLIRAVENVQRYFTRRLLWPRVLPYRERLALFNLDLLQRRRIKFDLYYCFKILNNLTCLSRLVIYILVMTIVTFLKYVIMTINFFVLINLRIIELTIYFYK